MIARTMEAWFRWHAKNSHPQGAEAPIRGGDDGGFIPELKSLIQPNQLLANCVHSSLFPVVWDLFSDQTGRYSGVHMSRVYQLLQDLPFS